MMKILKDVKFETSNFPGYRCKNLYQNITTQYLSLFEYNNINKSNITWRGNLHLVSNQCTKSNECTKDHIEDAFLKCTQRKTVLKGTDVTTLNGNATSLPHVKISV